MGVGVACGFHFAWGGGGYASGKSKGGKRGGAEGRVREFCGWGGEPGQELVRVLRVRRVRRAGRL
jgi:hypothetical protein